MLPMNLREALLRMSQLPKVEHLRRTGFALDWKKGKHRHQSKTASEYGTKGRYAAKLTTPVALRGMKIYKQRTFAQALRARRRGGRKKEFDTRAIGKCG